MQTNIHPTYYPNSKVTCSCGNTFETGSTLPEIKVEICSACHPFFTGEMRFVDTQGRVERFEAMRHKAQNLQAKLKSKKKTEDSEQAQETAKTLREMMEDVRSQTQKTGNPAVKQ